MAAVMLIAWGGAAVGSSGVESLFFSRFGVQYLPEMFIALGVVTFPVTVGVSGLLAGPGRRRTLVAMPLGLAAVMTVLRLLLVVNARWIYPVLWLGMMVVWIVLALDTWGLAGLVHDPRAAKRLFPLYGAAVILGSAVGGLLTRPLVQWIHAENLLIVWAASLVATSFAAGTLPGRDVRRRRAGPRPARPGPLHEAAEGARYVRRSPLLRRMSVAILLSTLLYYALSLPYAAAVTARFPSSDQLAAFLGPFSAATNLGALLLSLLLANRVFSRLGVPGALVTLPALYAVGFAMLTWAGAAFAPIVGFRFVQLVWMSGVWFIGWQAVWGVVPGERRAQARAFVEGGPMQWGVMAAGVLLLLSEHLLTERALFAACTAVAVAAVAAAWAVKRAYGPALVEALRAGWPEVFVAEEEPFGGMIADRAARETLAAAADDGDPSVRRVAIELLASGPWPESLEAARRAVADPDPGIRAAGARAVAASGPPDAAELLAPLLVDPDAGVRAAAAAASPSDRPDGLVASLRPLLTDPVAAVRVRAAQSLLRAGDGDGALGVLLELASSPEPEERAEAVRALGELDLEPERLASAIRDPEPAVRRAAAAGLGALGPERGAEALLEALGDDDPTVREAVADALVGMGGGIAVRVAPLLEDHRREATALAVMVRLADADPQTLLAYARAERARALHYHEAWRRFSPLPDPRVQLLAAGLRHRALRHAEHAVHAVAPFGDHEAIDVALQTVGSRDPNQRAYALDTVESATDGDLVRPLLAVWEPVPGPKPADGSALRPLLAEDDPWIRACAALAAGTLGRDDQGVREATVELARADPDPFVREAAGQALREDDGAVEALSMLSLMDRVIALRGAPLFRELSPEDLKHVAEALTENAYVDGTVIAMQGDPGDAMHVVVSGSVRVVRHQAEPEELAVRGPGYIVGEMAVLAEEPRMADLVAVGDVRTVSLDRRRFQRILRERPDAALAVMRELSHRLLEATARAPGSSA